jgi:hypothetical protein
MAMMDEKPELMAGPSFNQIMVNAFSARPLPLIPLCLKSQSIGVVCLNKQMRLLLPIQLHSMSHVLPVATPHLHAKSGELFVGSQDKWKASHAVKVAMLLKELKVTKEKLKQSLKLIKSLKKPLYRAKTTMAWQSCI